MSNKEKLIEIFKKNVQGKIPDVSNKNKNHDGKFGHWLEQQFGITANGKRILKKMIDTHGLGLQFLKLIDTMNSDR